MRSGRETVKKRYNKKEKAIGIIALCCIVLLLSIGIRLPKVFASDTNPIIEVNLDSSTQKSAKSNEEIAVNYNITPDTFNANANNNIQYKEIAVLIDTSSSMFKATNLYNNMLDVFTNSKTFKSKITIITYNSVVNYREFDSDLAEYQGDVHRYTEAISKSSTSEKKLGSAINKAIEIFNNSKVLDSIKNIIIIGSGNPTENINTISLDNKSQYNIITLDTNTGVNSDTTSKTLEEWHNALGGIDNNYFISSDQNYINNVATPEMTKRVLGSNVQSYSLINAKLNFDLDNNFEYVENSASSNIKNCTFENNKLTLNLPIINYRATTQNTDGTYIHTASAFTVSFKIKPKEGKIGDLGFASDSKGDPVENLKNYISYNKLNNIESKEHINTPTINIVDETLPKINVKLNNPPLYKIVEPEQEIEVKYQIDTEPFEYNFGNSPGGRIDEAVFVVDLSKKMGDSNNYRWELMEDWFEKILLNDTYNNEDNILKGEDIKFAMVGNNGTTEYPLENGEYDKLFDRTNSQDKNELIELINGIKLEENKANGKDGKDRSIGVELKRANEILSEGEENAKKAIILVNCSDITDLGNSSTVSEINAIKANGYKIISLNMFWNNSGDGNLKTLHNMLGGSNDDYFNSDNYNGNPHSLNGKVDMSHIANSLKLGITQRSIKDAKLNFDLGENFEAVEDGKLNGTGKIRTVTLPEIKYTLTEEDGKYLWYQTSPQPLEITFNVRPVSGKGGTLGFGAAENNTISYTNFSRILKTINIDTPIVVVKDTRNIEHGLYKGLENDEPSLEKMETPKLFAKGSTVTFGAYIDGATNNNPISIKFDPKLDGNNIDISKIKVFKIENGKIVELSTGVAKFENNIYTYTPLGLSKSSEKILIRYIEVLPKEVSVSTEYKNTIIISGVESNPAIIRIRDDLPDLF